MIVWPKWLDKKRTDNVKDEKAWAKRRGGRTQNNSGRSWYAKADVRDSLFLTDTKETERNSFTVSREMWETLTNYARANHRIPCFKVKLIGNPDLEFVVLPADFLDVSIDIEA